MFPDEALLCVANLEHVQFGTAGVVPHGVWMRTGNEGGSGDTIQAIISALQVIPEHVGDLGATVAADRARLERLGVFGVLSVCFIAGALLAALGLLMHTMVSLRSRALRFAILQALGLTQRGVLGTVFVEFSGVLLYSVVAGTVLGIVAADRYAGFFTLTETAAIPVPPYLPLIDRGRAALLPVTMVVALALSQLAVLLRLAHMRVFEVLRLGTRE